MRYQMYEKGYLKAFMDILDFVDSHSEAFRYYRYKKFDLLLNLIKFLTKYHDKRRLFMNFGGDVEVIFKDTEIIGVNNFDGGLQKKA